MIQEQHTLNIYNSMNNLREHPQTSSSLHSSTTRGTHPHTTSTHPYPGLLTSVFVVCSTNAGKGLVKLSYVQWRTWTFGGVAQYWKNSKQASVLLWQLSAGHQTAWRRFFNSETCFTAVQKECTTPPHVQVSHCMWLFTRTSHRVSTASDKRWGEKAWVRGHPYPWHDTWSFRSF